nr:hypothetical protein [Tanacetum cinerariifolium]GFA05755.1 hypothetical protein [Tanacetum cinerariifolium]
MKQVTDPIPEQQRMLESPILVMDSGGRNHNRLLQAEVELSDDSREKLYNSYMKKRDARLKESWDSNGAEKERMKAINDSLECQSTEMKATFFSWSKDRQNFVSSAQRRVEKLRKNTGIGPGAGSVAAKMKASMVSEAVNKDEEYDKPVESRMSPESEILINSESKNGNTSKSFSQVDHTSVVELPATVTSSFPVQDSPGESQVSWNSHTNYPFSYNHEAFDFESPMRSPASWNLQPTEVDAARMRKK